MTCSPGMGQARGKVLFCDGTAETGVWMAGATDAQACALRDLLQEYKGEGNQQAQDDQGGQLASPINPVDVLLSKSFAPLGRSVVVIGSPTKKQEEYDGDKISIYIKIIKKCCIGKRWHISAVALLQEDQGEQSCGGDGQPHIPKRTGQARRCDHNTNNDKQR